MVTRGRKPIILRNDDNNTKLIKRNYYIAENNAKALMVLSALTGKDLSILVNEAIDCLINKYQPKTNIDLHKLETIKKED